MSTLSRDSQILAKCTSRIALSFWLLKGHKTPDGEDANSTLGAIISNNFLAVWLLNVIFSSFISFVSLLFGRFTNSQKVGVTHTCMHGAFSIPDTEQGCGQPKERGCLLLVMLGFFLLRQKGQPNSALRHLRHQLKPKRCAGDDNAETSSLMRPQDITKE